MSSLEAGAENEKPVDVLSCRLYSNHITDVGAKLVARVIAECPRLRVLKYVSVSTFQT